MTPDFVPNGSRPSGIFPSAPRVIYKTKRKNLSHEGRIGRINKLETLNAFRQFSHAFQAHRPRLDPSLAGYLHNHGFLPDKGALYGLSPDTAGDGVLDPWLSDYQASVLPMVNGRYAPAIANRLLFWRLYGGILPLAPLVASVQEGRLVRRDITVAGQMLCRPMQTEDSAPPAWTDTLDGGGADRIVLDVPPQTGASLVTRMLVLYDPKTRKPVILNAVLLEGPLEQLNETGTTLTSRLVDLETGIGGAAVRFTRGALKAPEVIDDETRLLPNWWSMLRNVTTGLLRLPVAAVLQIDLIRNAEETDTIIVDVTDRIDAAAHQVHGPLMGGEVAVRFLKEFGV